MRITVAQLQDWLEGNVPDPHTATVSIILRLEAEGEPIGQGEFDKDSLRFDRESREVEIHTLVSTEED